MCMQIYIRMCIHGCGGQRTSSGASFQVPSTFILRQVRFRYLLVSISPGAQLQVCVTMSDSLNEWSQDQTQVRMPTRQTIC